jgi:hypothetical protein
MDRAFRQTQRLNRLPRGVDDPFLDVQQDLGAEQDLGAIPLLFCYPPFVLLLFCSPFVLLHALEAGQALVVSGRQSQTRRSKLQKVDRRKLEPDDIEIRVRAVGICRTDLLAIDGGR